jgi:cytoskeletal protein CcmA (bactofilin family)
VLKQIIGQRPTPPPGPQPGAAPAAAPSSAAAAAKPGDAIKPSPPKPQPSATSIKSTMSSNKNILSSDVEIKGSLKFSNDLIIDGRIEGEVSSDGNLTIGENAYVSGEVKTKSVVIFGKVQGNITVGERCELKSNATLEGDIVAGTLAIEEGATFMGKSSVGAGARAAMAAASKAASQHAAAAHPPSHAPSQAPSHAPPKVA